MSRQRRMNWAIGACALILGMMVSTANAENAVPKNPVQKPTRDAGGKQDVPLAVLTEAQIEAELAKRRPVLQEWLEGVGEVVKKVRGEEKPPYEDEDESLEKCLKALQHGLLFMPVKEGAVCLEPSEQQVWIAVTPLLPEDRKLGVLQDMADNKVLSSFTPQNRVLLLQDLKMTRLWRGMVFMRELAHADRYFSEPYDLEDEQVLCHEERFVQDQLNRWTSRIGGKQYDQLVAAEAKRHRDAAVEAKEEVGNVIAAQREYEKKLDKIFGKALSKEEEGLRQTQLWVQGHFHLIEELPNLKKDDRAEKKALFLKTVFRSDPDNDKEQPTKK